MRESYFASDVKAILTALEAGNRQTSSQVDKLLDAIQENLQDQLADELAPEREWRCQVASSLEALCDVMRKVGKPTPSVETLAEEMAI